MIRKCEYTQLQNDYEKAEEWVKDLSYAILSLQTGDSQQFNLSDYYQGGDGLVYDEYAQALLKGGVLESGEGELYISDLNIKEYQHMEENKEGYTKFLWNVELFRKDFSLWGWIVWDMDYETYRENSEGV